MMLSRSSLLGTATTIADPGTTMVGAVRKRSSVALSHVRPESINAFVYVKAALLAARLPKTRCKLGPCAPPLSFGSALWQRLHCSRKALLPAFASAANVGAEHSIMIIEAAD